MPPNRKVEVPVVPLEKETGVVHKPHPHDSARLHVRGAAPYLDDIREPSGTLHVAVGMADKAAGELVALDLSAVRAAPGVVAVVTAADIPGKNDIAPVFGDEPLFAEKEILFHGEPLFAVAATTREAARRAARLAKIEIAEKKPALTIEDALVTGARVLPDYEFGRGDVEAALARAPHRLEGQFRIGGQEHFYLEGQASLAIPGEGGEMVMHVSTQDPTEVAAYRGAHSRRPRRVRHRRDAPHGRRLRRQGEPGLPVGGDRRALRARDRAALQDPARSRRRHGHDGQAPRFSRRLAHRL